MDDHDQLKFFSFFYTVFLFSVVSNPEKGVGARENAHGFGYAKQDSYLYCPAFTLVVSHELENQSIGRRFWSIARPL